MAMSWVVALIFFVLSIVFLVLWMRARGASNAPVGAASGGPQMVADLFEPEQEYQLLGRGELNDGGKRRSFGVVRHPGGDLSSFLINDDITHLNAGDTFRLHNGQMYKVRQESVASASASAAPPSDDDKTMAVSAVERAGAPADVDDGMTVMVSAAQTEAMWQQQLEDSLPTLDVIEGVDSGSRFVVPFDITTIGRSEANGVSLREEGSSRVHCEVAFVRPNFLVRDLQSTNGTLHNGVAVDEAVLSFGDTITISDTVLVFGCKGFALAEEDSEAAVEAFEHCLDTEPDFLPAVKNLAFLLERDIRRKKEAQPLWDRVAKLEKLATRS